MPEHDLIFVKRIEEVLKAMQSSAKLKKQLLHNVVINRHGTETVQRGVSHKENTGEGTGCEIVNDSEVLTLGFRAVGERPAANSATPPSTASTRRRPSEMTSAPLPFSFVKKRRPSTPWALTGPVEPFSPYTKTPFLDGSLRRPYRSPIRGLVRERKEKGRPCATLETQLGLESQS